MVSLAPWDPARCQNHVLPDAAGLGQAGWDWRTIRSLLEGTEGSSAGNCHCPGSPVWGSCLPHGCEDQFVRASVETLNQPCYLVGMAGEALWYLQSSCDVASLSRYCSTLLPNSRGRENSPGTNSLLSSRRWIATEEERLVKSSLPALG